MFRTLFERLKQKPFAIGLLLVATAIFYLPMLRNGLVLDDHVFIENWQTTKSLENLPKLLMGELPPPHGGVYRPVRSLFYLIYRVVFGSDPFIYHLHALVIHLLSTVLVYLLLVTLFSKFKQFQNGNLKLLALLGALLFGAHPIHSESLMYASAGMEVTGVVFCLSALVLSLRTKQTKFSLIGITILSLLSYLTYEMTFTLPPLFILISIFSVDIKKLWKQQIIPLLTISFPLLFVLALRLMLHIPQRGDYLGYSFWHTQLTMLGVYVKYLSLLLFPFKLSYIHEIAPGFESFMTHHSPLDSILSQSIFDLRILLSLTILGSLVGSAIYLRKKIPGYTLGLSWMAITLLPVAYLLPQGIALAEKYLYLPSIGLIIAAISLLSYLWNRYKLKFEHLFILLVLIATIFGARTAMRTSAWQNDLSFWRAVVNENPSSSFAHYTYAVYLSENNEIDAAKQEYETALSHNPKFFEASYNLGLIFMSRGKVSQGILLFQKALHANPDFTNAADAIEKLTHSSPRFVLGNLSLIYPADWELEENINQASLLFENHGLVLKILPKNKGVLSDYASKISSEHQVVTQGKAQIPFTQDTYALLINKGGKQFYLFFLQYDNTLLSVETSDTEDLTLSTFDFVISHLQELKN